MSVSRLDGNMVSSVGQGLLPSGSHVVLWTVLVGSLNMEVELVTSRHMD